MQNRFFCALIIQKTFSDSFFLIKKIPLGYECQVLAWREFLLQI